MEDVASRKRKADQAEQANENGDRSILVKRLKSLQKDASNSESQDSDDPAASDAIEEFESSDTVDNQTNNKYLNKFNNLPNASIENNAVKAFSICNSNGVKTDSYSDCKSIKNAEVKNSLDTCKNNISRSVQCNSKNIRQISEIITDNDSALQVSSVSDLLSRTQKKYYDHKLASFADLMDLFDKIIPKSLSSSGRGLSRGQSYTSQTAPATSSETTASSGRGRGRGRGRGSVTAGVPSRDVNLSANSREAEKSSTPVSKTVSSDVVSNCTSSSRSMVSTREANKNSSAVVSANNFISDRNRAASARSTATQSAVRAAVPPSRESSPEIEVVSEKRLSTTPKTVNNTTIRSDPPRKTGCPLVILLNILARPRNMLPVAIAVKDRKELDAMVKGCLVKNQQDFTEWLFSLRLLKDRMMCPKHPSVPAKLALLQGKDSPSNSCNCAWMLDCCPSGYAVRRYVSVYSGSIFAVGIFESLPATSVLKLIYHWSCQTTIVNVENWVKVNRTVIGRIYHYLRCVCAVMLQETLYDIGKSGSSVELGIVSLGTTSQDGAKKSVKVEILGLFDRTTKAYRLFATAPMNNANSTQRFMRILKPVLTVVSHKATIICDGSIDKTCLPNMDYNKVIFCVKNHEETTENSNSTIMSYLRAHVPKMFQNSLSQLSLEQVQLMLDELCWRESFGRSPMHSYTNMMKHLGYLTQRESRNSGLLSLLDFVSLNPHKMWRYEIDNSVPRIRIPADEVASLVGGNYPLPPLVNLTRSFATGLVHPGPDVKHTDRFTGNIGMLDANPENSTNPLLHLNKVVLTIMNNQVHSLKNLPKRDGIVKPAKSACPPQSSVVPVSKMSVPRPAQIALGLPVKLTDSINLDSFFYGEVLGDDTVGKEENFCDLSCHKCSFVTRDNILFYKHMKTHLYDHGLPNLVVCRYCILQFPDESSCEDHINEVHSVVGRVGCLCKICMISFESERYLIAHMEDKHVEAELPYRCEVCNYATSFYVNVIDHFVNRHRNAPYIQCHFCLSVRTISPGNCSSLSGWLLSHLSEHSKGVRCNFCVLTIRSKGKKTITAHMVSHASFKLRKDLIRYAKAGGITCSRPRTSLRLRGSLVLNNPIVAMKPAVAMSRYIEDTKHVSVIADSRSNCMECEQPMNSKLHFGSYLSCTLCGYATNCSVMMPRHNFIFHNYAKGMRLSYDLGAPIILKEELICNCGFTSVSGNHIARHIATCSKSTKVAYPVDDAPQHMTNLSAQQVNMILRQSIHQIPPMSHFLDEGPSHPLSINYTC